MLVDIVSFDAANKCILFYFFMNLHSTSLFIYLFHLPLGVHLCEIVVIYTSSNNQDSTAAIQQYFQYSKK